MASLERTPMQNQAPEIRKNNFLEVALGFSEEEALQEASRCLNCKVAKCRENCPVNVNIPDFIALVKEKEYEKAYDEILKNNYLPAICGRVCPQESQCEGACVRGIKGSSVAIGSLERFVADYVRNKRIEKQKKITENGVKVAVVGSGPSGLACGFKLREAGFDVTIFEALNEAGGVLTYGIPEFRLPKKIVAEEIEKFQKMGGKIALNTVIGKTLTIDELRQEYAYIYIGSGAGLPNFMNIPGEEYNGVISANEFLTRTNLMKSYLEDSSTPIWHGEKVAVIGGGNVAMDSARTALRLGAKNVYIIYRRSMEELPARKEEVHHAEEEGIEFKLLTNPVRIIGDESYKVKEIECVKMELGEADASGRRRPIEIKDSNFTISVDTVIMALGTSPNPLIKNTTKSLETDRRGCIVTDSSLATSLENIYAGGDCTTGAATVILAMGAGLKAAKSIIEKEKMKND